MRVRVVPIAELVAERADGSAVSSDALAKALAKPTPIVLGYSGAKIDPAYLGIFKPDTLVVFLPKPATTIAPPGAPVTNQPAQIAPGQEPKLRRHPRLRPPWPLFLPRAGDSAKVWIVESEA